MPTSYALLAATVVAVSIPAFSVRTVAAADSVRTAADELPALLKTLQAVGPRGAGNREAGVAWAKLVKTDSSRLPLVLAGLDGANPLAANWIRTAVDVVAQRQLDRGGQLPAKELERFVLDTHHASRARRLAYEWLCRVDASAPERLIPGMLNDPSLELRRDAIARRIDEAAALAQEKNNEAAVTIYRQTLTAARDIDQIRLLADRLRKLGQTVDLPRVFGFLVHWQVMGPFDNTGEKGFDVAYPPETESQQQQQPVGIDRQASYQGKHGPVRWIDHTTTDDYGYVDLNKVLGEEKGVIGYVAAEFLSAGSQEVEFRASSFSALKLWLNGRLIDEHKVYFGGSQLDQYVCRAKMKPGRNLILLKVCQNEQTQDWANIWGFQFRVCTADGAAVLSTDRNP